MDLLERAKQQEARLFEVVLPAFIDRFFSGDGHELLFQLNSAAERRELPAVLSSAKPTEAALERAHFVRVNCPLRLGTDAPGAESVEYLEQSADQGGLVTWSRCVVLRPAAFTAQGLPPEAQDDALFFFLLGAYVRYFEAVARHPASRTLKEARAKDGRVRVWRATKWAGAVALVLSLAGIVAWTSPRTTHAKARPAQSAAEREKEQQAWRAQTAKKAAELSRRIRDAAERELEPAQAIASVGSKPFVGEDPLLARLELAADPEVPGAQAPPPGALLTLLWLRPDALSPLRFAGLSWDATGRVHRVDVVNANALRPVELDAGH